jgi:aminopeptidase N
MTSKPMKTILTVSTLLIFLQFTFAQKVDVYNRPVHQERSRDFDAIHYKVTLNVDMDKKMLNGENQITLLPLNNDFDKIRLDAEYLEVSAVINIEGKALPFEQNEKQVVISLPKSYNHNDTIRISVKYKLIKPIPGLLFMDETATCFSQRSPEQKIIQECCWQSSNRCNCNDWK